MKLVRAGLLVRADHRPHAAAVLRAHAVGNDGKIFNGLERRIDIQSACTEVIVILRAIEHVRRTRLSRSSGSRRHIQAHAHLRRHKGQHVKDVAVDQRGVLDGRAVDLESEIGSGCLNERGLRGYFNDLAGLGQFQLDGERHDLTCLHNDSGGLDLSKICRLHVDCVRPRRHERKAVGTVAPGGRGLRNIRAHVGDGHRGVWHHSAGRIRHGAGDDALHGL